MIRQTAPSVRRGRTVTARGMRMLAPRSPLTRRVAAALDASPSRIPVLLGPSGSGRSTLLGQLRDRVGRTSAQLVDLERTATTPERFLQAIVAASPFPFAPVSPQPARAAFDQTLAFLTQSRHGGPATFLLDEFLELRTFESFPGLRRVLPEFIDALSSSGNRFVLTSRYTTRALRTLRERSARFEVIHMPAVTVEDTLDMMPPGAGGPANSGSEDAEYLARTVQALAEGRPAYVRAIADELASMRHHGGSDAISALVSLLSPCGTLDRVCHFTYELRLHRARGYGALKAILDILAEEEDLTLTEISHRLQRTPGSTKDYLSWLEDVDLVTSRRKRYSFVDPLLRIWVRLYCRPTAPTEDDLAREVHQYALARLPHAEPALAMVSAGAGSVSDEEKKPWGIIEID
jgi:hypothetical protein